jgi:hypothetical protein
MAGVMGVQDVETGVGRYRSLMGMALERETSNFKSQTSMKSLDGVGKMRLGERRGQPKAAPPWWSLEAREGRL